MPTNTKYTLNIEPVNGHLEVTIPEIGVTVETVGTKITEAAEAGHRAIVDHLIQKRKKRGLRKRANGVQSSPHK